MLTENEVATIINDEEIHQEVKRLKKEFKKNEAPNLELNDHDFLSLVLMIPTIGIAMANKSISFKEEMELNKKARRASKGAFFMKKDPVVHAMKFLIKKYEDYEEEFYGLIVTILDKFVDMQTLEKGDIDTLSDQEFRVKVMKAPFLFVRIMRAFFLAGADEDVTMGRKFSEMEFGKLKEIGVRLNIQDTVLFKKFLSTIDVK